jgi:hypothetical protein
MSKNRENRASSSEYNLNEKGKKLPSFDFSEIKNLNVSGEVRELFSIMSK